MSSGKHRVWIVLLILFLGLVVFLAKISLDQIEKNTRRSYAEALSVVLETSHESITSWIVQNKSYIRELASDTYVVENVIKLLEEVPERDSLLQNPGQTNLRNYFSIKRNVRRDLGFFVISKENISLGSMRNINLGTKNLIAQKRPGLLKKVFSGETVFIPPMVSDVLLFDSRNKPTQNLPTMFFASPVINSRGKIIAALTIRLNPESNFTRLTQVGRIGKTGETYAFDKHALLISNSRFDNSLINTGLIIPGDKSILSIRILDPGRNLLKEPADDYQRQNLPLTFMAERATKGLSGSNTLGYRDYRGVVVIGAWLWDSENDYGLSTEIDMDEALNNFYITRRFIISLISITILLSLSLSGTTLWLWGRANRFLTQSKYTNDLLEMSKIEAGSVYVHNDIFDLYSSIENIKEMTGLMVKSKGLEFNMSLHKDVPRYIISDERKIRLILLNIISNALKYTDKGYIKLNVKSENAESDIIDGVILSFEIEDTGSGIPESGQKEIPEAFAQSDSGDDIIKEAGHNAPDIIKFVSLLGGEISVKSLLKKGSVFIFSLPVIALSVKSFRSQTQVNKNAGYSGLIRKTYTESEIPDSIQKPPGVQYNFDEKSGTLADSSEVNAMALTVPDFKNIPEGLIDELANASKSFDLKTVHIVIEKIRHKNLETGNLLYELAKSFRYDKILDLVKNCTRQ